MTRKREDRNGASEAYEYQHVAMGEAFGVQYPMASPWIRVSDRLPEPRTDCWGRVIHPGVNGEPDGEPHVERVEYSPGGPWWYGNWYNQISCMPTYNVTHWMPHVEPRWVVPDPALTEGVDDEHHDGA